jgi:hypothetical protein
MRARLEGSTQRGSPQWGMLKCLEQHTTGTIRRRPARARLRDHQRYATDGETVLSPTLLVALARLVGVASCTQGRFDRLQSSERPWRHRHLDLWGQTTNGQ